MTHVTPPIRPRRGGRTRVRTSLRNPGLEALEGRIAPTVDLSQFKNFLPDAFDKLQVKGVNDQLYKVDLPLIAGLLKNAQTTQGQFLAPVEQALQTALAGTNSSLTQSQFLSQINTQLGSLAAPGIEAVGGFGDPAAVGTTNVEYKLTVGLDQAHALTGSVSLASDLGLSGLGIHLNGNVTATLSVWYTLTTQVGITNNAGAYSFYVNTAANPELTLHVAVQVSPSTQVAGSVGLLQFAATASAGTGLQVDYTADLFDSDGRLTTAELNGSGVDFRTQATVKADVLLAMTAQFGGSAINPKVTADFNLHWNATGDPEVASLSSFGGAAPTVKFDNVRMNVQSGFLDGLAKPLLDNIRRFTGPIEPIVAALNYKPLAPLSDITVRQLLTVTPLGVTDAQLRFFDVVTSIVDMANAVKNTPSGVFLDLGSFNLTDPRQASAGIAGTPTAHNALTQLSSADKSFYDALVGVNGGSASPSGPGLDLKFLQDPTIIFKLFVGDPNVTLFTFTMPDLSVGVFKQIPLLTVPVPPFGPAVTLNVGARGGIGLQGHLSLGYDTKGLVEFQTQTNNPSVIFDGFYVDTTRPLLEIGGWDGNGFSDNILSLYANITVGLDINEFANNAGVELPDWFGKAVDAGSPINLSAKFELEAGLKGNVQVRLTGNNNKFRLASLGAGGCIFTVNGAVGIGGDVSVTATAKADVPFLEEVLNWLGKVTGKKIKFKSLSYDWDKVLYTFPTQTLFTFNTTCGNFSADGSLPPELANPQLATLDPATGQLRLNVGAYIGGPAADGKRQIQPTEVNEHFNVYHVSGSPTDPAGETVRVEAFGVSQVVSGVKTIYADAGEGLDEILLDDAVLAPCTLLGGAGNDTLKAGAGAAYLDGGPDNDTLTGSPLNDTIVGGGGGDVINAGEGSDLIVVGQGNSQIVGGGGNDTLREQGDVNFVLNGNTLTGLGTHTLSGIENVELTGGAGANSFTVRRWLGNVTLSGLGGNDQYRIEFNGSGSSRYSVIDASGDDTLTARGTDYNDDLTVDLNKITDYSEQISFTGIEHLIVDGGDGEDHVNVRATAAGSTTAVLGGDGSDLIRVSSLAGSNDNGDLSGIRGALSIDAGGGGANRLVVSNFGGRATAPAVIRDDTDGYTAIAGMAAVPILYKATGGAFFGLPADTSYPGYDPDYGVIIRGSNADADEFRILTLDPFATMKVEGNGGDDVFNILTPPVDDKAQTSPDGVPEPIHLTLDGGVGYNTAFVTGGSQVRSGRFLPSSNQSAGGNLDLTSPASHLLAVDFTKLQALTASAMGFLTLVAAPDLNVLTFDAPTGANGLPALNRVSGDVKNFTGTFRETDLNFFDIPVMTVDSAERGLAVTARTELTIDRAGFVARGLSDFTFKGSAGNDLLTVNTSDFRFPVAGGRFTFDGGTGLFDDGTPSSNLRGLVSLDRVVVNADVDYFLADRPHALNGGAAVPDDTAPATDLIISQPGGPLGGLGALNMSGVESAVLNGGLHTRLMDGSNFSGALVMRSGGGDTTLYGGSGSNVLYGGSGRDTLYAGTARTDANNLLGGGGINLLIGGSGVETFVAGPGAGTTTMLGGSGSNTFIIRNPSNGSINAPTGGFEVIGGSGARNDLTLTDGGDPSNVETYTIGAFSGFPAADLIWTLTSLGLDVPAQLANVRFDAEITTSETRGGLNQRATQSVRVAGLSSITDTVAAKVLYAYAAPGAGTIGASGSNLAGGTLHLTTGAGAFAPITFANKGVVSVFGPGGKEVPTSPAPVVKSVPAAPPAPAPAPKPAPAPEPAKVTPPVETVVKLVTPAVPVTPAPAAPPVVRITPIVIPPVTLKRLVVRNVFPNPFVPARATKPVAVIPRAFTPRSLAFPKPITTVAWPTAVRKPLATPRPAPMIVPSLFVRHPFAVSAKAVVRHR